VKEKTRRNAPLNRSEFARRYGVSPSTITKALQTAAAAHAQDPTYLAPPKPMNPGSAHLVWTPAVFDAWWDNRPRYRRRSVRHD
jgi:hypothetical protein